MSTRAIRTSIGSDDLRRVRAHAAARRARRGLSERWHAPVGVRAVHLPRGARRLGARGHGPRVRASRAPAPTAAGHCSAGCAAAATAVRRSPREPEFRTTSRAEPRPGRCSAHSFAAVPRRSRRPPRAPGPGSRAGQPRRGRPPPRPRAPARARGPDQRSSTRSPPRCRCSTTPSIRGRSPGSRRSLGLPDVSVHPADADGSIVNVVVSWELCWYRYEVDLSDEVPSRPRRRPGVRALGAERARSPEQRGRRRSRRLDLSV